MRLPMLLSVLVLGVHVHGQCHYAVDTIDKLTGERRLATKAVLSLTRSNASFTFEQQKGHLSIRLDLCQMLGLELPVVAKGDSLLFDTKEGVVPLIIAEGMDWELQEDSTFCARLKSPIELDQVNTLADHGVESFRITTREVPLVFSIRDKATWPAAIQEAASCFLKGMEAGK